MDPRISGAIEVLQEDLELKLQEVAETKRTINSLRARAGEPPMFEDVEAERTGSIRPDQFYGKPFARAVREFLQAKRQASSAQEIMDGLQAGGFDYKATGWKKSDWLRTTSMSIAKNTKQFHRLPNGTYGLVDWYDLDSTVTNASAEAPQEEGGREGSGSDALGDE